MHATMRYLLTTAFGPALRHSHALPATFLIPSLSIPQIQSQAFSTSPQYHARSKRDRNPNRGVSALRHSGLRKRQTLSVKLENLPKPVLDPRQRSVVEVSDEHGLWEFFNRDRESLSTPELLAAHGRAWTVQELRTKDWDDLWKLWWTCVKERNRVETFKVEKERLGDLSGGDAADRRLIQVSNTQKRIKYVLTERWYTWENARYAAMEDEEVNLAANPDNGEIAYIPKPEGRQDDAFEFEEEESIAQRSESNVAPPPDSTRSPSEARI